MKLTTLPSAGDGIGFVVPGDPIGYVRMTRAGRFTARAKKYHAYMASVQAEARRAGLKLPLEATEHHEIRIITVAKFRNRRHPDPGNVQKAFEDALFYGSTSGDKYVGGEYAWPTYDDEPLVFVTVRRVR